MLRNEPVRDVETLDLCHVKKYFTKSMFRNCTCGGLNDNCYRCLGAGFVRNGTPPSPFWFQQALCSTSTDALSGVDEACAGGEQRNGVITCPPKAD